MAYFSNTRSMATNLTRWLVLCCVYKCVRCWCDKRIIREVDTFRRIALRVNKTPQIKLYLFVNVNVCDKKAVKIQPSRYM